MSLRALFAAAALAAAGVSLAAEELPRSKPGEAKPRTVCAMIYKPVCAWDKNGRQQIYSNECLAKAAGATVTYPAPCISDITF